LHEVAVVQRQLLHLLRRHRRLERRHRLHQLACGGYFDRLRHTADRHLAVDLQSIVDVQRDAANRDGLKTLQLEHHFVVADRQQGCGIESGFVGHDRSRDASVVVLDGNGDAGQRAASLVSRASCDCSGCFLR